MSGVRATVGGPDDTEEMQEQIEHWKDLLCRAEDLQWFGDKKKKEESKAAKKTREKPAIAKKATKISKRDQSGVRESAQI